MHSDVIAQGADSAAIVTDRNSKEEIFQNCSPFTDCTSELINT